MLCGRHVYSRIPAEEALDRKTNSPCHQQRKCLESSMGNNHPDVRV